MEQGQRISYTWDRAPRSQRASTCTAPGNGQRCCEAGYQSGWV